MSDSSPQAGAIVPAKLAQPVNYSERGQAIIAVFPAERPGEPETAAIVKQTERGLIRSMLVRVPLREELGDLWTLKGWDPVKRQPTQNKIITAQGYQKLNKFIGVSFLKPERVLGDDGVEHSNPYMHRDETGAVRFVRVRTIGIGRNPLGNLMAFDYTLTFDLHNYFLQDLMSKWSSKKSNEVPKDWGMLLPAGVKPPADQGGAWHYYALPGGVCLWVDLSARDVQQVIQEHLNKMRMAERNAQTMAERNVMKRFTAQTKIGPDGTVPVVSYMEPDRNFRRIAAKVAVANAGSVEVDGESIDLQQGDETVDSNEEVDAALAGEAPDEDTPQQETEDAPAPGVDVPPENPAAAASGASEKELNAARGRCRELINKLGAGSDDVAGVLSAAGLSNVAALADVRELGQLTTIAHALENAVLQRAQQQKGAPPAGTTPPASNMFNEPPPVEAPPRGRGRR